MHYNLELRRDMDLNEYYRFANDLVVANHKMLKIDNIALEGKKPLYAFTFNLESDIKKQHVLFTAMHAGVEYSGSNTLIMLIKWLVGKSDKARNFLLNYSITIVPVPNPYAYEKGKLNGQFYAEKGGDPYSFPWTLEGVFDETLNWEAAAIKKIIDTIIPELYIDCHGVFYKNQTMIENTGVSVHGMNRPHHTLFVDSVNEAAKKLGYHCEQYEMRQKPLSVVADNRSRRYQTSTQAITACTYAYHNYHTLAMTMEIGFEQSGLARLKKALELGLSHWDGEYTKGFPVNRLYGEGLYGIHSYFSMRKERKTLWQSVDYFSTASVHPQYPGKDAFLILNLTTADKISNDNSQQISLNDFSLLLDNKKLYTYINDNFKNRWLALSKAKRTQLPSKPILISLKIPFKNSKLKSVKINGVDTNNYKLVEFEFFSMVFVNFSERLVKTTLIEIEYQYSNNLDFKF